jgi:hypothetical protein
MERQVWTDERLDDVIATLRPLPAQVARNTEAIEGVRGDIREIREDIRAMRADMSTMQRQFAQMGWTLAVGILATLLTTLVTLIVTVA